MVQRECWATLGLFWPEGLFGIQSVFAVSAYPSLFFFRISLVKVKHACHGRAIVGPHCANVTVVPPTASPCLLYAVHSDTSGTPSDLFFFDNELQWWQSFTRSCRFFHYAHNWEGQSKCADRITTINVGWQMRQVLPKPLHPYKKVYGHALFIIILLLYSKFRIPRTWPLTTYRLPKYVNDLFLRPCLHICSTAAAMWASLWFLPRHTCILNCSLRLLGILLICMLAWHLAKRHLEK